MMIGKWLHIFDTYLSIRQFVRVLEFSILNSANNDVGCQLLDYACMACYANVVWAAH